MNIYNKQEHLLNLNVKLYFLFVALYLVLYAQYKEICPKITENICNNSSWDCKSEMNIISNVWHQRPEIYRYTCIYMLHLISVLILDLQIYEDNEQELLRKCLILFDLILVPSTIFQ